MIEDSHATSSADYAEILEQAGVAVLSIGKDGVIVHANRASENMFGYPAEKMLGRNVSLLMSERHADRHHSYVQHYLATGEKKVLGIGRRVEGVKADGTVFPMHISVGQNEEDGEIQFTGILHDLSKLEVSRAQALRFGRIINESSNEIYVFDASTLKFALVNHGALKNLGYEGDEMLEMTPLDIKTSFTEKKFRALIAPLIAGESNHVSFQCVHTRKDGSQYDADVTMHLSAAVDPTQIVAIIVDCTERNRMLEAVQQSQKMESIGQLTGGIAHDFNNLLTVITGNLELLEMSIDNEEDIELIDEALSAAKRGAKLTASLLAFARRTALSPKKLNLNDVVLDLSDLLIRSVGEHISFSTILSPDLWSVKVDQSQADSALMNLTINARDAMSAGGMLTIETSNRTLSPSQAELLHVAAGNYVQLCVSDTGTGIEPEHLQSIFEPFFTTKSKSQGHGLGLSMVYGFARQSGGCLTVSSDVGSGSQFTLLLPRYWPGKGGEPVAEVNQPSGSAATGACVLLVEDDAGVRKVTKSRLQHLGLTVFAVADGMQAYALYKEHPEIDLLLTDMVMPGALSGWDLARKIRDINPQLPVILSSGYSEQLQQFDERSEKSVLILAKPYTLDALKLIVSKALQTG